MEWSWEKLEAESEGIMHCLCLHTKCSTSKFGNVLEENIIILSFGGPKVTDIRELVGQ